MGAPMKKVKKAVKLKSKELSTRAPVKELYKTDFFKWTKTQANFLKKGVLNNLDIDNLIEEIESLGRNDKRALRMSLGYK